MYELDADLEELRQARTVKRWLRSCSASDKTIKNYTVALRAYSKLVGFSPDELIKDATDEIKSGTLPNQFKAVDYILDFKDDLKKQGLKSSSIQSRLNAIYSFYKWNGVIFQHIRRSKDEDVTPTNDEYPEKDMIRKVLTYASPLSRAIILTGAASGLSQIDIINLKVADFKNGYDPDTGITRLNLIRIKTNFRFTTFLTHEASQSILDYLEFRNRTQKYINKKRQQQLDKQRVLSDTGYLFIVPHVPDEWLDNNDEQLRQLTENNVQWMYNQLCDKACIATEKGTRNVFVSHGLRKFANNAFLQAGINSEVKEFLLAHKIGEARGNYNKFNEPQMQKFLLKEYIKAIPYLTVQKELDIQESEDFKRIKQENQILAAETARHVVERSELQDLRAEMEKMKEASTAAGSIKEEYMQFADMKEILEMKDAMRQELEEISKLKEMMFKIGK